MGAIVWAAPSLSVIGTDLQQQLLLGRICLVCKAATGRLHVIKFADDHCRSPGGSYAAGP